MAKLLTFTNPVTIPVLPLSTHVDLTGPLKLDGFSHVSFAIVLNQPALFPLNARVLMGELIATPVLAAQIDSFAVPNPLDRIRTYAVVGPQLNIQLFGNPATYSITAWVYLT